MANYHDGADKTQSVSSPFMTETRKPKIDIYPDGWGMKIENSDALTEAEVQQLLKGLAEMASGETKSIADIRENLRKKGN
jgi:hypothetical protein